MAVKSKQSHNASSPASQMAGWARQGIESYMAAQKILLDLTAQQNALVIGMLRESLSKPLLPGVAFADIADHGVHSLTAAGKILLDMAASGTDLVADGVEEVVRLPLAATTMANVLRHRVLTFIGLQKRFLEAAAEQTHEAVESYRDGEGLMAVGAKMAHLARRALQSFVDTEKEFLDLAAHEVNAAAKAGDEGRKPKSERMKVLTRMVRDGGEICVDAQKKLINLAIEQMESAGENAGKHVEAARKEARTSWSNLTEKSVRNIASAEKSLMNLVVGPAKEARGERKRKVHHPHARPKMEAEVEKHKAA